MTFDPNTFFSIAVPLTIMGLLLLKPPRARPVRLDRLWIVPVAVGGFIGMGLYFMPHAPFGRWAYAAFALALAAIAAIGLISGGRIEIWRRGRRIERDSTA